MSNLENIKVSDSYKDIFRLVNGGNGLDAILRNITGGDGSPTGLYISNSKIQADMNDGILRRPTTRDSRSLFINLGDVSSIEIPSGTVDIDLESADIFKIGLDSNITTLNIQNAVSGNSDSDGRSKEIMIIVEQKTNGSPGWANITWDSAILWPAASVPSITQDSGALDVFRLIYINDGSDSYWFGEIIGQDMRNS